MQVQSCKNGLDVYRDIKVNIYIKLSISAIISPIELAWSVGNIPHSDFIAPTQPFIEREEEEDRARHSVKQSRFLECMMMMMVVLL